MEPVFRCDLRAMKIDPIDRLKMRERSCKLLSIELDGRQQKRRIGD